MKHLLLTTIAAVLVVGCAKPKFCTAIQVKRLFFSPAENELLPVLGVRLIERLEH